MFGWINDCTEKMVIEKFGVEKWHEVKTAANCGVPDNGFIRHERYRDASTISLVQAASSVLGLTFDEVLETFGSFFMEFVRRNGYENLLKCQGSTLRTWLSNINALHDHLESSLPRGMVKPVFWVEDDDEDGCDGVANGILLHYYSKRGNVLVPLVVGVIKEVARFHFDANISMELIGKQDVEGAKFTTWKVKSTDPLESWKITTPERVQETNTKSFMEMSHSMQKASSICPFHDAANEPDGNGSCPFSGVNVRNRKANSDEVAVLSSCLGTNEEQPRSIVTGLGNDNHNECFVMGKNTGEDFSAGHISYCLDKVKLIPPISIRENHMMNLFPYHIVLDEDFSILQVGKALPNLLESSKQSLLLKRVDSVLRITKPVHGQWNWKGLNKLYDQSFFLEPVDSLDRCVPFKGSLSKLSNPDEPLLVMLILTPDAKNVAELREMNLTMSDLPLHSFQRDSVFLGEHIASEVKSAHWLDRLSKKLQQEKEYSNSLLFSIIPRNHPMVAGTDGGGGGWAIP